MAAPPIPSALDARTQIFPTLTPSQIDRIRPQGHVRHVDRGEILFDLGDTNIPFDYGCYRGLNCSAIGNIGVDRHTLSAKLARCVLCRIEIGPTEPAELICLTIEARRKHYGGEVHLVVAPSSNATVRHHRPASIKAVARGHAWYEKVLEGKVVDMTSLARETGLTPHYVRNVFACAFLAPDIVEAILEGRQPLTLKFENLYKHIPLSWAEQRRQFGFPQDATPGQIPL